MGLSKKELLIIGVHLMLLSLSHFLLLSHREGNKIFALLWSLLGTTQRRKATSKTPSP